MALTDIIDTLFKQGLGELPVFYYRLRGLYLGNMVYVKGRIFFKDQGLLQDVEPPDEQPDWKQHLLGMVCYRKLLKWESLSFYGLDYCVLDNPAADDRVRFLKSITNSEGERLYDFVGSIYRACHLMLDHGLLPVVLLHPVQSRGSGTGLAIADLRALFPDGGKHDEIARIIRKAIEKQTTLDLDDVTTDEVN